MRFVYFEFALLLASSGVGNSAPIAIHPFDIYPSEYLEIFSIIYDEELAKQFLKIYHQDGPIPNQFYADVRYEFPNLEKRIRGIVVNVQQRARHLSPKARDFLELMSKHVDVVLAGSESSIRQHVKNIINQWSKLTPNDKESYREQFPDSALILESERYQQLISRNITN